jgi:hypothetical protein
MNNIQQQFLNDYYANEWTGSFDDYVYSGYALIDKVSLTEWVLDVGCGSNPFKGKINNLIGVDPANPAADVMITIDEFQTSQVFDVAFCLGSINFNSVNYISTQIGKIVSLLNPVKSRIYWRCNPGYWDHGTERCHLLPIFPWTNEMHYELAPKFGFQVADIKIDRNRIYAEWVRG